MNEPIKAAIAWLRNEAVVTPDNRMYAGEIADQAAADLARITAERDAAISDLQDAVDFVYNVYGENNETLAAITTAHWRAVIADVKRSV